MRAKPSSNSRSSKTSRANSKSLGVASKGIVKKGSKEPVKKTIPDLSVLRQPVDTSICGLKQAVKVFETGTPEVLHLLTYDCDVVYECKVCRNLFRSIANFISHKRIYCTVRYSRAQDLQHSNKEGEDFTLILGEQTQERLPTRITARKDLTSILESLGGQNIGAGLHSESESKGDNRNAEKKSTTIHLEPIENTSYGVFQTVLKPDSDNLMRSQVTELQKLLAQNEVILGPDGRILQNGSSDVQQEEAETESNTDNDLVCSSCNVKFANRKTLTRHKRIFHESVRTCYSCPCCKNYFANPWSVYRHLYKVHRKTNEQVRRLRSQIHKKDIKIEKPTNNNVSNKKVSSPSKKKADTEVHTRLQQDNKEWMDHFEDDWELQRCGGCGRKFERKAALLSHAQICQKRIMACNRIKHNYQDLITSNMNPIVAVSPLPCSKKPVPKPSPEKKIGIQVRMNYCKNGSQVSERQQTCSRSVLGDESDLEAVSVDGKETFFQQGSLKEGSVLDKFLKNANSCRTADGLEKVNSYLNNSSNRIDKLQTCEISTCKRSTIMKSNMSKNKSLEAKCLQLRSALESGRTETLKSETKMKELDNTDNTSESNTSAVSSLSSQLTPPVDKHYVCEVEESIEIKNINISRSLENVPSTEADSTSMTNGGRLHMTFNAHMYSEKIKYSPNGETTCEEVSTSVISDEMPHSDSVVHVDSSYLQDDEISVDLKPVGLMQDESKNSIQESELENTISILTRNQLKAICKDDLTPNDSQKVSQSNSMKKRGYDAEVEAATREIAKKKLTKYVDEKQNQCTVCSKRFKTLYDVYRHIPTHTQCKRYECLFNGCTFQTYLKSTCLHHVTMHTQGSSGAAQTLVGKIDPSKWDLKILKTKSPIQSRPVVKLTKVLKKDIASQKLAKTLVSQKLAKKLTSQQLAKAVNRLSKKPLNSSKSVKVKLKTKDLQIVPKQPKISKIMNNVSGKQKLLTEFKHFNRRDKINGKNLLHSKRSIKNIESRKTKVPVNNASQKKSKSSSVQNVSSDSDSSANGNPLLRKNKVSASISDQGKVKFVVIKNGKSEEIIVNNMSLNSNESVLVKGRSSRSSSRRSSVNSVDQPRGNTFQNAPFNSESPTSVHIQSPEIVDGTSSLEEEESQESDKPVDDTHFKKILEVIFGPSPRPAQMPGRPVRNKSRPKRDSDFILGSPKEGDKDIVESKSTLSKKSMKALTDCKSTPDSSRKTK